MDKKIIFQKCNLNNIYFLLYFISSLILNIIDVHLEPDEIREDDNDKINMIILIFKS